MALRRTAECLYRPEVMRADGVARSARPLTSRGDQWGSLLPVGGRDVEHIWPLLDDLSSDPAPPGYSIVTNGIKLNYLLLYFTLSRFPSLLIFSLSRPLPLFHSLPPFCLCLSFSFSSPFPSLSLSPSLILHPLSSLFSPWASETSAVFYLFLLFFQTNHSRVRHKPRRTTNHEYSF